MTLDAQASLGNSCASLIDPDVGNSLNFIPAGVFNGTKFVKLKRENVAPEIDYWQNATTCSVRRPNPPFAVMEGFMKRI